MVVLVAVTGGPQVRAVVEGPDGLPARSPTWPSSASSSASSPALWCTAAARGRQVTKAANQLVVACTVEAVAEALARAAGSGVLTPAADVVRGHAVALAATMPDVDHAALVTLFAPDGLDALAPPPGGTP